ncbi:MAG: hypothetical protein ABR538_17870 [Candidatus Binatia bacterium]
MDAAAFAVSVADLALLSVSGLAVLVAPGAVLLAAADVRLRRSEAPAFAFAASLFLNLGAFAACLAAGTSIAAAPVALAMLTAGAALAARLVLPPAAAGEFGAASRGDGDAPSLVPQVFLVVLAFTCVAAAVAFAPVGSVDRWWYLAYVRGYLDSAALSLAEPFLGSGEAFARFGLHPWLFALATWSRVSGLDPVVVYETGAPVLAVLVSVSAAAALAFELFGRGPRARLAVIATLLLWSGAAVPVLARAGEDKVLAASALLPLCFVAFLRMARAGAFARSGFLLFVVASATAAVHALDYAFVLVVLIPTAALLAWRLPGRRRGAALAAVVLLVVALAPAASGVAVSRRLGNIGAELAAPDHPVVRVHEARDRLVQLPVGGFVVHPRLLLHPLAILALVGVGLLVRRRSVAGSLPENVEVFLGVATVVPLVIAFVPPLPALAGHVIPPWMVYRVLWVLPLAPLAAVAAEAFASRFSRRETAAACLLLAMGLPMMAATWQVRLAEVRDRLATPATPGFRALVESLAALPADAIVVAAPELAERLPAFTARHLIASLDRSTIVFAGSRSAGEARLRARAALLVGDDDAWDLARAAGVTPTHAVYDPQSGDVPRCGAVLYRADRHAVCELSKESEGRDAPPVVQPSGNLPSRIVAEGGCGPAPSSSHRDPWSAAAPVVSCRIAVPAEWRASADLRLVVETKTGRAVDELRVRVRRGAAELRAVARSSGHSTIVIDLPPGEGDEIDVRLASSFLPVVRPLRIALGAR